MHPSTERPQPLVSIVVLNWNGDQHIHRCIEHVLAQTYQPLEVIVVDNGSTDGSMRRIRARFRDLNHIENGKNLGYASGMNRGIEAAHGRFVVPLNQDVCLAKDFVSRCVERMVDNPTLGVVGGRVLTWSKDTLTTDLRHGEGEHFILRKRFQGDAGNVTNEPQLTFGAAGCFPFFRRETLEDLRNVAGQYYDEAYITGWNDFDIYFRMHLRGWKCLFAPDVIGWHVGSGSVGGNSTFFSKSTDYQEQILRNRYFTIFKDLPMSLLLWLAPYLLLAEGAIPFYFMIKSPKSLKPLVRAWVQVLRAVPSLMKKRSTIQGSRTVGGMYFRQYFVRL